MKQKRYLVMVPIEPGHWSRRRLGNGRYSVSVACPKKWCTGTLTTLLDQQGSKDYPITDVGRVTPRLRCTDCDAYEHLLLKGWDSKDKPSHLTPCPPATSPNPPE